MAPLHCFPSVRLFSVYFLSYPSLLPCFQLFSPSFLSLIFPLFASMTFLSFSYLLSPCLPFHVILFYHSHFLFFPLYQLAFSYLFLSLFPIYPCHALPLSSVQSQVFILYFYIVLHFNAFSPFRIIICSVLFNLLVVAILVWV